MVPKRPPERTPPGIIPKDPNVLFEKLSLLCPGDPVRILVFAYDADFLLRSLDVPRPEAG